MLPEKIEGAHVELGREQGFVPLYVRFELTTDTGTGQTYPSMVCQMRPTEQEVADIVAGKPLFLRIIGVDWPPVAIYTNDEFNAEAAKAGLEYVQAVMHDRAKKQAVRIKLPVAGESEQQH